MEDEKRIYLLRHAEPKKLDQKKRYLGHSDPELSEKGRRQAVALADYFSRRLSSVGTPCHIYCSDLKRAHETAHIIASLHTHDPLQPKAMSALREIDMGEWDGKSFDEIKQKFPDDFEKRGKDIAHFRPPGGESFVDLEKRVMKAFDAICQESPHRDVIVVAHAGVNRVILRRLLGKPFDQLFTIRQGYAGVNEIRLGRSNFHIVIQDTWQPVL